MPEGIKVDLNNPAISSQEALAEYNKQSGWNGSILTQNHTILL